MSIIYKDYSKAIKIFPDNIRLFKDSTDLIIIEV
jgi:hypothetical protein